MEEWLILGHIWDEPEASYSVRKYTSAQTKKTTSIVSKGHRNQLKELSMAKAGRIWATKYRK